MTPDQLSRIEQMASGSPTWDLSPNDLAALRAILAERAEVVRILSEACNSASNPGAHRLALKCLTAMGERVPERKEGR